MIRVGLPEKVTFEESAKGFKEVGPEDIWRKKSVQKEATACAEVLWQGVCPACPRDPKGTSMAGEDKTAGV